MSREFHVDPSWVVPAAKLHDFIPLLRSFLIEESVRKFEKILGGINQETLDKTIEDLSILDPDERMYKTLRIQRAISLCRTASSNADRLAALCIDCHICVWVDGRKAFVVPFSYDYEYSKFEPPEYADDYSCWSTGDEPEKMPKKEWKKRQKSWSKCFGELNSYRLINTVIEADKSIGVSEITKHFVEEIEDAKSSGESDRLGESV